MTTPSSDTHDTHDTPESDNPFDQATADEHQPVAPDGPADAQPEQATSSEPDETADVLSVDAQPVEQPVEQPGAYPPVAGEVPMPSPTTPTPPTMPPTAPPPYGPPVAQGMAPAAVQPMSPDEARQWSILVHLSAYVLSIIAPAVALAIWGQRDRFLRDHIVEALNFQITVAIALLVSGLATILLIGFVLLPVVAIAAVIFPILAAVAASKGETYRYPLTLRLVR